MDRTAFYDPRHQKFSCSGNLATMAPGLPYAIAAQIAFPERQSIAFVGDGGFTMLMGEFVTAVKYNLPIKVVIIKNNTLGQIKWEQMVFLGNPEYGCRTCTRSTSRSSREACGGVGFTVEDPDDSARPRSSGLIAPGPAVLRSGRRSVRAADAAEGQRKQAAALRGGLDKGQPQGGKIALTIFRDKINELL